MGNAASIPLTASSPASWLEAVWPAIFALEESSLAEVGQIDNMKTAMAWITEELGLKINADGDYVSVEDTNPDDEP